MDKKDDLQRIQGIGPAVEKRLNQAYIRTYAQLSPLQPDEIAEILKSKVGLSGLQPEEVEKIQKNMVRFSSERIADEGWIKQAEDLHSEIESGKKNQGVNPKGGMHYTVFTVEFLLNDDNEVRRTLIKNVQTESQTSWASWDPSRLTEFFIENAGLNIPQPVEEQIPQLKTELAVQAQSSEPSMKKKPAGANSTIPIGGEVSLQKIMIKGVDWKTSPQQIHSEHPFTVQLTLDLHNLKSPAEQSMDYSAVIFAKPLSAEPRQMLTETEGNLNLSDCVDLEIADLQLAPGIYRLEAFVRLIPSGATPIQMQDLMAMTESSTIHVF
jgi:predicted flap endonuclease-1-like 5' DNA nuclease